MPQPIDLYYWPTPNGKKVAIFLEEADLPYNLVPVDITAGDQFDEEFLKISPNNKMPAIVDPEGPDGEPISLFESGAILIYLAEKTGRFLPEGPRERYEVLQWLMFQMGHVGPMLGQAHHFRGYAPEKIPYAIDRYTNEAARLYGVMDKRLSEVDYFVGEYSIVDMAIYPWV
ncbi:MAG: GSH-dependent disulfide-bond oxidoreductase, partial [Rubrobacteraceae bacterium]|nr:GSH-dependent disulfide-bond oxidoreductase [Rubrobacteraceae bacterium]